MSFNDTVKLVFNHYSVKSWQNICRAARPLFTKIEIINCFSIRVNTRSDLNKYQSGMYCNKPSNGNAERMCSFFFSYFLHFFLVKRKHQKSPQKILTLLTLRFGERDSEQFQEVITNRTRNSAT